MFSQASIIHYLPQDSHHGRRVWENPSSDSPTPWHHTTPEARAGVAGVPGAPFPAGGLLFGPRGRKDTICGAGVEASRGGVG